MIYAAIVAGAVLLFCLIVYNTLVVKRNLIDNAFAAIDVQLKKRHDLIPNLVSAAQAYMKHESGTLTEITRLRTQAAAPALTPEQKVQVENQLSAAIRQVMVQVEAYPELKASAQFDLLMRSLNEIEEQLSAARRSFNMAVTEFNTAIQFFPVCLFATAMGFTPRTLLSVPENERAVPNVANLFQ